MKIRIRKDGPYLVEGNIPLNRLDVKGEGEIPTEYIEVEKFEVGSQYALCRCSLSKKKPFCDGSHREKFDGTLTYVDKDYYEEAEVIESREFTLYDNKKLCSGARFCMEDKGTWILIFSKNQDKKEKAKIQVANCPSGRLVLKDREGNLIEPKFEPAISILEDSIIGVSGPVWIKGEIPIETDSGEVYKVRNRVTLCRCGKSKNKPLCDKSHFGVKFRDETYFKKEV
ncbi:MAG: CDGSH iron-sulfur domain-containing protein [Hydrogenothermaceae bacterium]|nr:CDGSH iron-sulfur domain-containing protein [Hydrogenothermaceae bacterium]